MLQSWTRIQNWCYLAPDTVTGIRASTLPTIGNGVSKDPMNSQVYVSFHFLQFCNILPLFAHYFLFNLGSFSLFSFYLTNVRISSAPVSGDKRKICTFLLIYEYNNGSLFFGVKLPKTMVLFASILSQTKYVSVRQEAGLWAWFGRTQIHRETGECQLPAKRVSNVQFQCQSMPDDSANGHGRRLQASHVCQMGKCIRSKPSFF